MIAALTNRSYLMSSCRIFPLVHRCYGNELETKYSDSQRQKILQVINEDTASLSSYEISKPRVKKITEWIRRYGEMKTIKDIEGIENFTVKLAIKLYDSIIDGPKVKNDNLSKKIKGQILQPSLDESVRQSCKSVLAVSITVNSVCWTLINRENYEVTEWKYYNIDYPNSKKMQITDIQEIAWDITNNLPTADIYVMKAEATTLRAPGSDPNNPKVLGVNLQKAQLVAMIVTFINAKSNDFRLSGNENAPQSFRQKVYFLRPTLPYRLYGTLVGNEHVSTDQTVENLLQEASGNESSNSHVNIPERLATMFRNQRDLRKDMLGQCLLLALTFMDVCVYFNKDSIDKLLKRGE